MHVFSIFGYTRIFTNTILHLLEIYMFFNERYSSFYKCHSIKRPESKLIMEIIMSL